MFDPVCGMEVEGGDGFCSDECRQEATARPDYYKQEPAIRLEKVEKTFELGGDVQVRVLRGLSLRIHKGELAALIGPSGSGKSTAMSILGTLDIPSAGKAFIAGREVNTLSEKELADLRSRKIGFVFQQFNLIPSLTALENVLLPKTIRGEAGAEAEKRAKELLESVGLGHRMTHKPMELSGGEQQRVAIARAFINDPEIILADEPTGNLDSANAAKIIDLIIGLWKTSGKTVIVVTHDPHVAEHARRTLSLKDGQLVKNGKSGVLWKEEGEYHPN